MLLKLDDMTFVGVEWEESDRRLECQDRKIGFRSNHERSASASTPEVVNEVLRMVVLLDDAPTGLMQERLCPMGIGKIAGVVKSNDASTGGR